MPCRIKRRRTWAHRITLEALVHPASSFVTLTYKELPENGCLVPRHLQLFLKRLRRSTDAPIRYFGVGEYGDHTWRPHYHLALFGVGPEQADLISSTWSLGHVYLGDLTFDSASYVAGYVTKKMTSHDDPRLQGRTPEFARMSLRPGIGALSLQQIADALSSRHGWDEINRTGDVPQVLKHGSRTLPLGPYLRTKLREAMNFETTSSQKDASISQSKELLLLYADYVASSETPAQTIGGMIQEKSRQKIRNIENKAKIYASKKGIGL